MATIQELIGYLEQMKGTKLVTILMPIPRIPQPVDPTMFPIVMPSESWYLQSVMIDCDVLLAALRPTPTFEHWNGTLYSRPITEEEYAEVRRQWEQLKQQSIYSDLPSLPKNLPPSLSDSGSENDAKD